MKGGYGVAFWLVVKIMVISSVGAIAIKYGLASVAIAPSAMKAVGGITFVPIIMAILLWYRAVHQD